ncbi:MAG: type II secretion system protein GspG [Sedimentisphaerales bacterium]|nr:type II secretion system protein GspG [Sedimentisphaerales bacterium]
MINNPKILRYVLAALVLASIFLLIYSFIYTSNNTGPDVTTRIHLNKICNCMNAYYTEKQTWPLATAWKGAIYPYVYDGNHLDFDYFNDGWGNEFVYLVDVSTTPPHRAVYSFGPDGHDNNGKGDDISKYLSELKHLVP